MLRCLPSTMVLSLPNTQTLNTVPHIVVTPPTIKLLVLILHNCNSDTVMNHNVSIFEDRGLSKGQGPTG